MSYGKYSIELHFVLIWSSSKVYCNFLKQIRTFCEAAKTAATYHIQCFCQINESLQNISFCIFALKKVSTRLFPGNFSIVCIQPALRFWNSASCRNNSLLVEKLVGLGYVVRIFWSSCCLGWVRFHSSWLSPHMTMSSIALRSHSLFLTQFRIE